MSVAVFGIPVAGIKILTCVETLLGMEVIFVIALLLAVTVAGVFAVFGVAIVV